MTLLMFSLVKEDPYANTQQDVLESVWIELIIAEIENWKYCSKIIFKCVNSIVGPIFNIF